MCAPHESSSLYPQLLDCEISAALNKEVGHYRTVAKKYKRAKKVVNWSAAGSCLLSAAFSSASFGSALSVVGLPATIPLGGVGGTFALTSSGLIIACKKLDSKIKNIRRLSRLPSLNATLLTGCFPKLWPTIKSLKANFS